MAWQTGSGTHQYIKESASAQRKELNLAALTDAQDLPAKRSKKRPKKHLGLKLYWRSIFAGRETYNTCWYADDTARQSALAKFSKEVFVGKPRYTKIEMVER